MATWIGVGTSSSEEAKKAAAEAAQRALAAARHPKDHPPDLVIAFCSSLYPQAEILRTLHSLLHPKSFIGCSTAGEISSLGPSRRSIVLLVLSSTTIHTSIGVGHSVHENPRAAGQQAAFMAAKNSPPKRHAFLIFPDSLAGNGADIIRGAQENLGTSFPIAGGSAGDDFRFQKTHQYFQQELLTDAVVGVLFSGELTVGIGVRHGWRPISKPQRVTKAHGNRVEELDGTRAANLYEEYFGAHAEELKQEALARLTLAYPLGMAIPGEDEYLLRNVLKVDASGALVYTAEIPEQARVRLMMSNRQAVMSAAQTAAEKALQALGGKKPSLGFIFNSVARLKLLGFRAAEEIALVQKTLGPNPVPLIGFYGYGEQAPLGAEIHRGQSHFHNESVVVVSLAEG